MKKPRNGKIMADKTVYNGRETISDEKADSIKAQLPKTIKEAFGQIKATDYIPDIFRSKEQKAKDKINQKNGEDLASYNVNKAAQENPTWFNKLTAKGTNAAQDVAKGISKAKKNIKAYSPVAADTYKTPVTKASAGLTSSEAKLAANTGVHDNKAANPAATTANTASTVSSGFTEPEGVAPQNEAAAKW
jgi:hypothetical protein